MENITQPKETSIEELLSQLYPLITPEALDTSRVFSILSDQMTFKVNDLLLLKEITKYVTDKEKLITCLKACDFLKLSEDQETVTYELPEGFTVFSILNFPPRMSKPEVEKHIELANLSFSRLYKKSLYWILVTNDKETVICSQNSLRDLIFDDTKVKYDMKTKTQILKMIKDQLDKNSYSKEASNLGIGKKKEDKSSNNGSEFNWRRRGEDNVASFDSGDKQYFRNSNNNQKKNEYKRNRFNSDNAPARFQRGNNQPPLKEVEEIEIDISNLKYSLNIKYKYSFQDMQQFLNKLHNANTFNEPPKYSSTMAEDIISTKPKEIVALNKLIDQFEKFEKKPLQSQPPQQQSKTDFISEANQSNVKIPKMNPLCSMPKMFNKFDMIPGNIPQNK